MFQFTKSLKWLILDFLLLCPPLNSHKKGAIKGGKNNLKISKIKNAVGN